MSLLGLVPMKGQSERVPGKNLRSISGRPLFEWILDALLGCKMVEKVMVDTDSDEIESAVAASFPEVSVHRRPVELHGDDIPMHAIVANVAKEVSYDHILQTHATNPLLTSSTIDRAIRAYLQAGDHDSLMGVTAIRSRFFFADGRPVNHDPAELLRTQDLEPLYEENSNLYVAPVDQVVHTGLRVGSAPLLFPIDLEEAWDIDVEFDFRVADFLLRERIG